MVAAGSTPVEGPARSWTWSIWRPTRPHGRSSSTTLRHGRRRRCSPPTASTSSPGCSGTPTTATGSPCSSGWDDRGPAARPSLASECGTPTPASWSSSTTSVAAADTLRRPRPPHRWCERSTVRPMWSPCDWAQGTIGTELVDRRSGERRLLAENAGSMLWGAAMSGDGTTVAYDDIQDQHQVVVADASTGEALALAARPGRNVAWGAEPRRLPAAVRGPADPGGTWPPASKWRRSTGTKAAACCHVLAGGTDRAVDRYRRHVARVGPRDRRRDRAYPGIGEGRGPPHPTGSCWSSLPRGRTARRPR